MDVDAYKTNFSMTTVNQDTSGWAHDYYLRKDDPSTAGVDSGNGNCADCALYEFRITNEKDVAQEIYVGAHTWQERGYGWFTSDTRDCTSALDWQGGSISSIWASD